MKADRELDARIAEKVFEQNVVYVGGHPHLTEGNDNYLGGDCPHFSTQIADAMPVLEKFPNASIQYCRGEYDVYIEAEGYGRGEGHSNVLAHAICLAALAVVERRE